MNTLKSRPLSPHLQIYRLPMAALMSITHRITGAALAGGFVLVAAFLVCAAFGGAECFNAVMGLASSLFGVAVLIAWSAALYYHTLNGVRHLIWDMVPATISKDKATASGWLIIVATLALTAATWHFAS